jgi:hypothetical protein
LWKDSLVLNIFVQRAGQGDGETLEDLPAQPVYILGMPDDLSPADTLIIGDVTPASYRKPLEDDPVVCSMIIERFRQRRR